MNRKGQVLSEGIILVWKIFLIIFVILFVVITITPVFTTKLDIRQPEGLLIAKSILECVSNNGIVEQGIDFKNCIILDENEYYINTSLTSFDSNLKKESIFGIDLEVLCSFPGKYLSSPSCIRQKYYVLINNNGKIEKGTLNLLIGIKKFAENVK
ncbi:MAG: hypothetical protein QW041_01280 [Candidatus Pacearchaeota archaeon]